MFYKQPLSPPVMSKDLETFMDWAYQLRHLKVMAIVDTPNDALTSRTNVSGSNLSSHVGQQCRSCLSARARTWEIHFFSFNHVDKRTALTYMDDRGNWHRIGKGAPKEVNPNEPGINPVAGPYD